MTERRTPRKPIDAMLNQHARAAFSGGVDGRVMVPYSVSLKEASKPAGDAGKVVLFREDTFIANGTNRSFWLTFHPSPNSERVFVNGVYCRQGKNGAWARLSASAESSNSVDFTAPPAAGSRVVVEYAYYEQTEGGAAFREVDLPHSFVGDDDGSVPFYLPFSFHGWGMSSPVKISSNGLVAFKHGSSGFDYNATQIWQEGYCLAPYWMDHDTRPAPSRSAGATKYGIVEIEKKTAFVVIWDSVAVYSSSYTSGKDDRRSRFQLVLYQNGQVEFNYSTIQTDSGSASGTQQGIFVAPANLDALTQASYEVPLSAYASGRANWDDEFAGPIVGYFLPGHYWVSEHSMKRLSEYNDSGTYIAPLDPTYGSNYAMQGVFGLTDNGAHPLIKTTNCGVPGRMKFNLGSPGPGITGSISTYSPSGLSWDGSNTTVTWDGLPVGVGMIADIRGTAQQAITVNTSMTMYYSMSDVRDAGQGTVPAVEMDTDFPLPHYGTNPPISSGQQMTTQLIWLSPYAQTEGHVKIAMPFHISSPVLRVHQVYQYVN